MFKIPNHEKQLEKLWTLSLLMNANYITQTVMIVSEQVFKEFNPKK